MLNQAEALAPLAPSSLPPQLARVLAAANAYQAMREPRPHREALTPDEAAAELRTGPFDAEAVEAVLRAAGHRVARRRDGPAGLTPREVEVLRLLARGLSNKEIAKRLSISPKTVGNHAEHIYAKIDTQSRAAAAFFAMREGLLPEEEFPARVAA
jgi:DNA-binding NarL/FixJ family response regulator